jgi:hypothetical protein
MDTLTHYRQIIIEVLNAYIEHSTPDSDVITIPLFDQQRDHYMVLTVGWVQNQRIHHCLLHLDIIAAQIWIQANNTDQLIAEELVGKGVAKNDIVLGMQPPEIRQFTEYGLPREPIALTS